ncbi:class A beta-lactamase [Mycobacterium sp. 1274756.6]|uniref:class A beta-lactamase n=1 Tax=Mycobacterium sp. 1274756.6 TaxID=1834076 RepID=UPI0007FB9EF8|nr:class A beta-lactamase [Mycobacterium sp. 1274756.6]OBJ70735.1 class A beta-lactamase [Mycobacterium sp. 1274756.6]
MAEMTRRRILAGVLGGAAAVSAYSMKSALAAGSSVDQRLDELEARDNATIGVFAADLASGRTLTYRATDSFAMCSTFKVYAAAAMLQRVQRDELTLDQPLFVPPAAIVPHSPRSAPNSGGSMTVAELCAAALQVSDNGAGNVLLQTLGGPGAVTDFARSIGDGRSRLDRWETQLNAAVPGDPRDTSTPEALGNGYRALLTGDVLEPILRQQLDGWMRANETSSMRAGLPPGWTSADKSGAGDYGSTNDVGIAYGPGGQRVLLALMTRSRADQPNADSQRALIGELTALILPEVSTPA